jgi:hypothetical protein
MNTNTQTFQEAFSNEYAEFLQDMARENCPHEFVEEHITGCTLSTLEDPGEELGYGKCVACGKEFPFGEYPENSNVKTFYDDDGPDPFDTLRDIAEQGE